jgi:exonuclease SbcD
MELRLLHTADVHLNRAAPERLTALEAVCRLTQDHNCEALLISGDLFDSTDAALDYKAQVQELFYSLNKKVFIIPGNHDATAFSTGGFYGANVQVAIDADITLWPFDGITLIGIPYASVRAGYEKLQPIINGKTPLVVLAHANFFNSTLSSLYFQNVQDIQKEACLWDRDFLDFPPSYIALGHWHNPTVPPLVSNLAKMAYSGSPYPIAKGENGPRKVFLVDVTDGEIIVEPVDIPGVPYRDAVSFFFVPGSEGLVLEEIKTYLEVKANPNIIIDIDVGGYLENIVERELLSEIQAIITQYRDGWKNIYLGTQRFLGIGRLPGLARKCLQLFNELEPPSLYDIDNFSRDPVLKELAQKVLSEEKEAIMREALEYMLRQVGRGGTVADS